MNKLFTVIVLTALFSLVNATEIRVKNDSSLEFKGVIVGENKYGDIKPGQSTEYQHWERAYNYTYVYLLANSKVLKIQPIDYVDEPLLGKGKFTYVLTIENNELRIKARKDSK